MKNRYISPRVEIYVLEPERSMLYTSAATKCMFLDLVFSDGSVDVNSLENGGSF